MNNKDFSIKIFLTTDVEIFYLGCLCALGIQVAMYIKYSNYQVAMVSIFYNISELNLLLYELNIQISKLYLNMNICIIVSVEPYVLQAQELKSILNYCI